MRTQVLLAIAGIAALSMHTTADACTNVIITKGASVDGSNIVSYAADSHLLYGELYFQPSSDHVAGSPLRVIEWDTYKYLGDIAQVGHTYKTVGNMNEHQLIIAETTWGGREELVDRKGGIDYGSLIYIALQRAKTAREAIDVIVELANEYGYASSGETFSIADKNEAWIMDLIGKGTLMKNGTNVNKGIVWVARRIPDGYICAHANQCRITTFPLNDPANCLYAKDVIKFARRKGYFDGADSEFSFRDAYCPLDFSGARACEARVWSAFNILSNGWFTYRDNDGDMVTKDAYSWIDFVMGYKLDDEMPLFIRPPHKISVKDVADVMRDHYEGTPMDMTQDIGAGGNALPYRWRPMHFSHDGKEYANERAIATQQTGFWFVAQARPYLPDVIGGLMWFGTDDAATSYLTPIYSNIDKVPECFRVGNGDILHYSPTSSFWINNRIANACYKMYNVMAPYVRKEIDDFENDQMKSAIFAADSTALSIYNTIAYKLQDRLAKAERKGSVAHIPNDPLAKVRKYLTDYSVSTADRQFANWVKLEETLLIKYIDGNVKAQNPDGSFKHSDYNTGTPAGLTNPGYTDKWKESVAREHGETVYVPEQ